LILPTDIPTRAQVDALLAAREPSSVSIYLPTNPASRGEAERIELKNLGAEAVRQLRDAGAARDDVTAVRRSWPISSTTTSSGATRHAASRCS
jgi:hypothetical protein